jgi:rRNA processing protein Gar1
LPPVEVIREKIPEHMSIARVGCITSIVSNKLVVVQSDETAPIQLACSTTTTAMPPAAPSNSTAARSVPMHLQGPPALDVDTLLCTADRTPIGRVCVLACSRDDRRLLESSAMLILQWQCDQCIM